MLNIKTIQGQGLLASLISGLIFVIVAGMGIFGLTQLSSAIDDMAAKTDKKVAHIAPLTEAANSIQFDVVQVQQWLTDISATRGLDGLNDGFDVAATFATKFNEDVKRALIHAEHLNKAAKSADEHSTLDLNGVISTLREMQASFPAYYQTGQKMAKSYIEFGPVGGNKMMASFDGTAAEIGGQVEQLMTMVKDLDRTDSDKMVATAEAARSEAEFQIYMLIGLFVVGILILAGVTRFTNKVLKIVTVVSESLNNARLGKLGTRICGIKGQGADADLQHNFNQLMDISEAYVREIRASMDFVSRGKYYRTILAEGMTGNFLSSTSRVNNAVEQMGAKVKDFTVIADKFEVDMKGVVNTVTSAAAELQGTARSMESTATVTSEKANVVASAADDASSNVQTVASAAEELSASISEISRQVGQSSEIASQAVVDADKSRENVQGLAESAAKIGEVISLISDIADQTNLLALNATIEAARAGEAGKGFAVVASEVKNLANQTAKATEEISQHVGGVQDATDEAVRAIKGIGSTISRIDEASTAIASAVEEQGAATQEIARNVEQAANGTNEVTSNITEVTEGAAETGHAAKEVLTAADELARQGDVLGREMDSFLVELRKTI